MLNPKKVMPMDARWDGSDGHRNLCNFAAVHTADNKSVMK
jgi:hypothetical protein